MCVSPGRGRYISKNWFGAPESVVQRVRKKVEELEAGGGEVQ